MSAPEIPGDDGRDAGRGADADRAAQLDRLSAGDYVSLVTLRADGTEVPTAVWVVRDGDTLLVATDPESGKVKRIRANPRVRLAPCDVRGRESGERVDATATLLDDAGTHRTIDLVRQRFGLLGRFFTRGRSGIVGISLALD